jgi:hypothetical protein
MLSTPHAEPLKHMSGRDVLTLSRLDAVPWALVIVNVGKLVAEFIVVGPSADLPLRRPGRADVQTVRAGERSLFCQLIRNQRKVRSRKWKKGLNKASRSGMLRLVDCGADSDLRTLIVRSMPWRRGNVLLIPEISYITTLSNRQIGIYRSCADTRVRSLRLCQRFVRANATRQHRLVVGPESCFRRCGEANLPNVFHTNHGYIYALLRKGRLRRLAAR